MSCVANKPDDLKVSDEIDKELRQDRRRLKQNVQILLLGAGESGKSTIFKQLKILQDNGSWTEQELTDYRHSVYVNVTSQMFVLVQAAERFSYSLLPENIDGAERIKNRQHLTDEWSSQVGQDIMSLWSDPSIQLAYERRDKEFQLNDSAKYFFDSLERILGSNYIPSPQDALRTRIMTKGIIEADVVFEGISMKIIDVGGQRSQRRKWIHCFDRVSAVIFVAGLSEYDQYLREDNTVNRMDESLSLFTEICNSQWFLSTSMILFLNKKDLFIEKLQRVPFKTYDPNYTGANSYDETSVYIKKKFDSVKKDKNKNIYIHFTVAVDTQNIDFVFRAVKEIILKQVLDGF
eukprot:gene4247-5316_t